MTNREELAVRLDALAEDARDDRWRGKGFSRSEWTAKRAWLGAMYAFDFAAQLIRESPVESSQEARRVCTCNAIDTPHGPAPDEKTPGCPVHSPAPAEAARVDPEDVKLVARWITADHIPRPFEPPDCVDEAAFRILDALDPAQSPESPIHAASSSPSVQGEAARVGPDCHKPAPSRLIYTCDTKPATSEKPKPEPPRSADAPPATEGPHSAPAPTSPTTTDAESEAPAPASTAAMRSGSETAKCSAGEPASTGVREDESRADWTQHDSPRRSMERQRARKLYEEDQIVTIWTDASVSPERSAIAVARAYPPAVLVARRTRAKSALKAEREALREGVSHAVAHIEAGKADRVIVRFDAPRAENGIGIPHPLQTRVELQHRLGVYNLAHSPATHAAWWADGMDPRPKETPMPPNEPASFTDEDRNRLNEITLGRGPVVGDPPRIARALAYIDHLEGAVARADELEASLGPLFDALVIDEEAPCGWFPSETEQILTNNAARAYRSARAALPTSKEDAG